MKLALALMLLAAPAHAQEAVTAATPLSDTDFYRLVSCAAPPGGACQKETVRWSATDANDVSIGIVATDVGYPATLAKLADTALDAAIAQVNASGAKLRLTRSTNSVIPDIAIHLMAIRDGGKIRGTGRDPLDGTPIQAAWVQLWWRSDFSIIDGVIVFAMDISPADMASVMLEEVTQSMGLLTDINSRHYETLSVFSETSNHVTKLGPQDIMTLRRHYP